MPTFTTATTFQLRPPRKHASIIAKAWALVMFII